jgi:uncharacterized membrane protein
MRGDAQVKASVRILDSPYRTDFRTFLTTIVSLEAIFLSTFVLVSRNRQAALADRRSELDLQINLLAEYEMTRVLTLVDRLAKKFDIDDCNDEELAELKQDVKPDHLLKELESHGKSPGHE